MCTSSQDSSLVTGLSGPRSLPHRINVSENGTFGLVQLYMRGAYRAIPPHFWMLPHVVSYAIQYNADQDQSLISHDLSVCYRQLIETYLECASIPLETEEVFIASVA